MRGPFVQHMLALLLATGCACSGQRGAARAQQAWTEEFVYAQPLSELWPRVEAHFRARGFGVTPLGQPFVLATDVQAEKLPWERFAFTRYYVRGEPEGAGTRIRVYRWTFSTLQDRRTPGRSGQLEIDSGEAGKAVPAVGFEWLEHADTLAFQVLSRERLSRGQERPGSTTFDRNFFRDLREEHALLVSIQPELAGDVAKATRVLGAQHAHRLALHAAQAAPRAVHEARCGESIPGLGDVVEPGGFLLLGELHGTQEVPRFVERAVCHTAFARPVVLALELPASEQRALERYLGSEGSAEDVRALTLGDVWHRPHQDGRTSRAVLALIEAARVLNRQGLPVSLLAYDAPQLQGSPRDRAMAERLLSARAQESDSVFLVLTGNVHASTQRGTSWDRDYEPMGWHLARTRHPVRSLDAFYGPGRAWTCRLGPQAALSCAAHLESPLVLRTVMHGVARLRSGATEDTLRELRAAFVLYGKERFFIHGGQYPPPGFHGVFYVTGLSPSPPVDPLTGG